MVENFGRNRDGFEWFLREFAAVVFLLQVLVRQLDLVKG